MFFALSRNKDTMLDMFANAGVGMRSFMKWFLELKSLKIHLADPNRSYTCNDLQSQCKTNRATSVHGRQATLEKTKLLFSKFFGWRTVLVYSFFAPNMSYSILLKAFAFVKQLQVLRDLCSN